MIIFNALYYGARLLTLGDKVNQTKKKYDQIDGSTGSYVKFGLSCISTVSETISFSSECYGNYTSNKLSKLKNKKWSNLNIKDEKSKLIKTLEKTKNVFQKSEITSKVVDTAQVLISNDCTKDKIMLVASTILGITCLSKNIEDKEGKVTFLTNWEKGSYLLNKVPSVLNKVLEYMNGSENDNPDKVNDTNDTSDTNHTQNTTNENEGLVENTSNNDNVSQVVNDVCPISRIPIDQIEHPLYYTSSNGRIIAYEPVHILTWIHMGKTTDPYTREQVTELSYRSEI